jgi:hypothetical protein
MPNRIMLVENFTVSFGFELPPGRPTSLPQAVVLVQVAFPNYIRSSRSGFR